MGTLGCINDMLRRDKENRELRRRGRERMKDTHRRLTQVKESSEASGITSRQMEKMLSEIRQKEEEDRNRAFRFKLCFFVIAVLIVGLLYLLFF